MGQIKNIKLHIVTDIKVKLPVKTSQKQYKMTNTTEKPIAEPVEEKKVVKEPATAEPESTTGDETELSGTGTTEVKNGNGHTEEGGDNGAEPEEEQDETKESTLKRDLEDPTEESPKKKKLIDSEEKEADAQLVEA